MFSSKIRFTVFQKLTAGIYFCTKKSTSQINSKKCSCCHAYQSLIQWINFDFILKPVSFHLKFVMLHNDSLLSQILLSNCCQMRSDIMVLEILYLILVQLCTCRDSVIYHQEVPWIRFIPILYNSAVFNYFLINHFISA